MKFLLLLLPILLLADDGAGVTVKGVVFDRQGAMASVIITELGTDDKNKAYTNERGEFEITTITAQPELEFTFVGYAPKRIKVKEEKYLKIKLKQNLLKD